MRPSPLTLPGILAAEALLPELRRIVVQLDDRDRSNLAQSLEHIVLIAEVREDLIPEVLADYPLLIGEGNRVMDRLDREERAEQDA